MQEVSSRFYKTMAILLQYPNKDLLQCVPELESYTALMPAGKAQRVIADFLAYLKSEPMLKLQQNYTAAFDMNPSTTLNMTYHLFGGIEELVTANSLLITQMISVFSIFSSEY